MPIKVEYVWIGGSNNKSNPVNYTLRSKTRVIYKDSITLADLPEWDYDGSSTGQADTGSSEVIIVPRALFNDPFRGHPHKLVLCDTYTRVNGVLVPHLTNTRFAANELFSKKIEEEPWYGIEQEFFLMDNMTNRPLGFPTSNLNHFPAEQFQYYCSAGSQNAIGRNLIDEIFDKAIEAGIKISGMNAEVAPGQWEIQVGPCTGIESGDHLWMLRYIMERTTEGNNCHISLHPKPVVEGSWNGSGCHTNYSTKSMREEGGYEVIKRAIDKLSQKHDEHIQVYGGGNNLRLTGHFETANISHFSSGIGSRNTSIRVPNKTVTDNKGYFEDRRPSSSMDPYLVTAKLFETTVLDD